MDSRNARQQGRFGFVIEDHAMETLSHTRRTIRKLASGGFSSHSFSMFALPASSGKTVTRILAPLALLTLTGAALADPIDFAAKLQLQQKQVEEQHRSSPGGYYAEQLLEPLEDLARTQISAGLHRDALITLGRAIQVSRSNHGLFAVEQLPLRRLELETLISTGQWDASRDRLDHLQYLLSRRMAMPLVDALELLDWMAAARLQGYLEDADEFTGKHLRHATRYREVGVAILEQQGLTDSERYAEALIGLSHSYYFESRAIVGQADAAYSLRQPLNQQQPLQNKTAALRSRYQAGLEALEKLLHARITAFGADSEAAAMALLQLADWRALFSDLTGIASAAELYGPVLQALAAAGVSQNDLQQAFAEPRPLPAARPLLSIQQLLTETTLTGSPTDRELSHTIVLGRKAGSFSTLRPPSAWSERFTRVDRHRERFVVELAHNPAERTSSWSRGYQTRSYFTPDLVKLLPDAAAIDDSNRQRLQHQLQSMSMRPAFANGQPVSSQLRMAVSIEVPFVATGRETEGKQLAARTGSD
jgi:hypothetical protein